MIKKWLTNKWIVTVGALLICLLFIFFVGTESVKKADQNAQTPIKIGKQYDSLPKMTLDQNKKYSTVIETSKGTIKANLFTDEAPLTTNNFIFLAKEGFYNEVKFHRIIKDFMVQTGDPKGDGTGGPGYTFADEPITKDYVRGTLAMANSGPDTNGSQFFIVHKDYKLDKKYTIFGTIDPKDEASLKVLDEIADTPVEKNSSSEESSPTEEVLINTITIEEK